MVPASGVLGFAGVAAVIVAIPGPSVMFTISRALTVGRRTALLTVVGNAVGVFAQAVAVAFGLGTLVERSWMLLTLVRWAGAAYLVYLGAVAFARRHSLARALEARVTLVPASRAVREGFAVGATNPKALAFFTVALPAFTTGAHGSLTLQLVTLAAVFPLIALVLDSTWALAAGSAREWVARSPRRLALVGGSGGLIMIGLGLGLVVGGRAVRGP